VFYLPFLSAVKMQNLKALPAASHFSNHGFVEMAYTPLVNGEVPHLPELDDVVGVPPVGVEVAVGELHDLAHRVQEGVKEEVEPRQPDQMIGKLKKMYIFSW
jgi:hypothetical protein